MKKDRKVASAGNAIVALRLLALLSDPAAKLAMDGMKRRYVSRAPRKLRILVGAPSLQEGH